MVFRRLFSFRGLCQESLFGNWPAKMALVFVAIQENLDAMNKRNRFAGLPVQVVIEVFQNHVVSDLQILAHPQSPSVVLFQRINNDSHWCSCARG
jgi:hypothetical protein